METTNQVIAAGLQEENNDSIKDQGKIIVIIDEVTPRQYSPKELGGCGGTEITVCAMAEALALKGFEVRVEQHNRTLTIHHNAEYLRQDYCTKADYVICLRKPESLLKARERFPNAKLHLWCHDLFDREMAIRTLAAVEATKPELILCVSDFHKAQIRSAMTGLPSDTSARLRTVYPPIPDELQPDNTPFDKYCLSYVSSPHKGLEHALELFKYIRRKDNKFTFHITNPGYFEGKSINQAGVKVLGSVDHAEVIALLRRSLCLFFPNTVFPETFGRVFCEAEAVGTPVLTHNLGAASEVISDGRELVDCMNEDAVIERVLEWSAGRRPTVRAKRNFRLQRIVSRWMREVLV